MKQSAEKASRADRLPLGQRVGSWIVRDTIAAGGGGTVYLGEEERTGGRVAIKVLSAKMVRQPEGVARFHREWELLARLNHPAIVKVVAAGNLESGPPYIVMELVSRETLEDMLVREGRLSPDRALAILEPICSALDCAHAAGVIHRDVKASNISVSDEAGTLIVKLLDFGLAKLSEPEPGTTALTLPGSRVGTPSAMAPEQIRGGAVEPSADIYALGVLIHRMLTGAFPFVAATRHELEQLHLEAPAPRASRLAPVSPDLDRVVARCLEKEPRARYPSVGELALALRSAARGSAGVADGSAAAVAIHAQAEGDGADEETVAALELAERALERAGFQLALQTATSVLGVRLVPPDAHGGREALAVGHELLASMGEVLGSALASRIKVVVHAGTASVLRSQGRTQVLGGAIVELSDWRVMATLDGVYITAEVAAGLHRDSATPVAL